MIDITKQLSDGEMFKIMMEDMRHIRKLLVENDKAHLDILEAMTKIRVQNAGDRVKLGGVIGGISLVISGIMAWIVTHLSK